MSDEATPVEAPTELDQQRCQSVAKDCMVARRAVTLLSRLVEDALPLVAAHIAARETNQLPGWTCAQKKYGRELLQKMRDLVADWNEK